MAVMAGIALAIFNWAEVLSLEPYKMSILREENGQGQVSGYYELNNEAEAEYLVLKTYGSDFPAVEIYHEREQFIDVIRPKGTWFNEFPSFCFGDHDQDGFNEIYLFTLVTDSILLNAYEPLGDQGHFIVNQQIGICGSIDGKSDITLESSYFNDDNGDGFEEFVFVLRAGFSLSPRRFYKLDIQNGQLTKGINSAAGFKDIFPADLNHDGRMDYAISANALENYPRDDSTTKYNDNSAWFLAFNNELDTTLLEIEFSRNKTHLDFCIREEGEEENIVLLVYELSGQQVSLMKYNFKGELIKSQEIFHERYLSVLNNVDTRLGSIVLSDMIDLYCYDDDLKYICQKESYGVPVTLKDRFDFLEYTGFHVFHIDQEVYLVDSALNKLGKLKLKDYGLSNALSLSLVSWKSDRSFLFSIRTISDGEFLINVTKRRIGRPGLLVNILAFIVFYALFYTVFGVQHYYVNRRMVSEQRIHSLQLQTVQNQLQPHFTFNVLNTIGSLIYKDEKEAAYEYLNHFSDMLRSALVADKQSDWMIDEELRFIKTFVAMENLRFDDRFAFELEIDQGVDISFHLPKLMVQTFVENAVTHGLMHKKEDCRLELSISEDETHIVIVVEDNGIGRKEAAKLQRNHTGRGNSILKNYMEVYNRIHKLKFSFSIADLYTEEGKARGTKVSLWIPKDYTANMNKP